MGLLADCGFAILNSAAGIKPRWPRTGGYLADRFSRKTSGFLLFIDWANDSNTLLIAPASCHLAFCPGLWVCNGRRLHVDSTGPAECFGTAALGKILALIIMGYSLGQWRAVMREEYSIATTARLGVEDLAGASLLGAAAIARSPQEYGRASRSCDKAWMARSLNAMRECEVSSTGSLNDVLPRAGTMDNSRRRIRPSIRVPPFRLPTNNTLH